MASVNEDGYVFQTTSVTDLFKEMLSHILGLVSVLKTQQIWNTQIEILSMTVSKTRISRNALALRNFAQSMNTRHSINKICDPDNTEFESSMKNFVETKRKITFAVASLITWRNLLRLDNDGAYAVPNGFEVVTMEDMFDDDENLPDVKILIIPDSVRVIYGVGPFKLRERLESVEGMNNVKIIGSLAFLNVNHS